MLQEFCFRASPPGICFFFLVPILGSGQANINKKLASPNDFQDNLYFFLSL